MLGVVLNAPLVAAAQPEGFRSARTEPLSDGDVIYSRWESAQPPQVLHVVQFNLGSSKNQLEVSPESAKGQKPSKLAQDRKALVSINGSFFDPAMNPLGLVVHGGKTWTGTKDTKGYFVFACTLSHHCAIEESRGYFSGSLPQGQVALALSGRPLLVQQNVPRSKDEDSSCPQFCMRRHPRAGLALTQGNKSLLMVVLEGRQPNASGASLSEFAGILQSLGAHFAINLDGGGSASLVVGGKRVSGRPMGESDERPVANILSIVAKP
jgi:exopolysaccharide biosynthesis protein